MKQRGTRNTAIARRWWLGYAVAVGGTFLAALLRWRLGLEATDLTPFITFYPVAFVSALVGGTRPGLLATILSVLAANVLFMQPVGKVGPATLGQALGIGLFVAINTTVSLLAGRLSSQSNALRESEARRQIAYQAAHIGAFELNVQTGVNNWSPELEAMYGLKPGEFARTESAWEQLVHPQDRAGAVATVARALATLNPVEGEWRVVWPDGSVHWLVGRFQAFTDHTGNVSRLIGVNIDITARKEAEQAVRQSEEHFRIMADAIPQMAWIARPDGHIFWYNRRAYEFTGATFEQLEGWGWQSVVDPQLLPAVLKRWRWSLATGEPYEMQSRLRAADGQYRTFLTLVTPLKDKEGKVTLWFGTHTDISAQKRAEAEITALRDCLAADLAGMNRLHALSTRFVREGDLQTLLKAILDAAIALSGGDKGHIQLFDPTSGKLELMDERGFGSTFAEYSSHIRPGVLASGIALQTHQQVVVEDITLSPHYHADPTALNLILNAGMRAVVCIPLMTRSEQLLGTLSVLFRTPHQPNERDSRLLDLLGRQAADILERTRTDDLLRAARQQLADANAGLERKVEERTAKLREAIADLEHMSYSMVHDMRAPLRAMQSFAAIAQDECVELRDSPALDYLRRIRESSLRLDGLITDALSFNKVVSERFPINPVDLGELLRGIVQSYPNLQSAEITVDFDEMVVLGNESLLTQCFGNLLDNAVKFVPQGVTPRVRVWAEPITIDNEAATSICVQDNGLGIPKQAQEKIFRMFQRMHAENEYPGTGIGLAIVRKAVERMHGCISLRSEPGKGSCFQVDLPRPVEAEHKAATPAVA